MLYCKHFFAAFNCITFFFTMHQNIDKPAYCTDCCVGSSMIYLWLKLGNNLFLSLIQTRLWYSQPLWDCTVLYIAAHQAQTLLSSFQHDSGLLYHWHYMWPCCRYVFTLALPEVFVWQTTQDISCCFIVTRELNE